MLLENLLVSRYRRRFQRFLMEVELSDGRRVIAHTPNTGTMKTLLAKNNLVYLSANDNPRRKLKYTTQIIQLNDNSPDFSDGNLTEPDNKKTFLSAKNNSPVSKRFCLVNTHLPNHLVKEGIEKGIIKEIEGGREIKKEVAYGRNNSSRVDLFLKDATGWKVFLEVKNATLKIAEGVCAFPDAPTKRGLKHLRELTAEAQKGHRAVVIFLVSRNDCQQFQVADKIDKEFYQGYLRAREKGVEFLAYRLNFVWRGDSVQVELEKSLPIIN